MNQSLYLTKKTHKGLGEAVVGRNSEGKNEWGIKEVDYYDGTAIEYRHDDLSTQLEDIANREIEVKDSIENAAKRTEEMNRKRENERLDKEYKNNI